MIKEWLEYERMNRGLAESTCEEYGKDIVDFLRYLRTQTMVTRWGDVLKEHVTEYVTYLATKGMKPATIKRRISTIRQMYQYAWLQGLSEYNPAKYVSTPKTPRQLPKILDSHDVTRTLKDETVDPQIRMLIALIAESGLRISEALNIRWEDIDQSTQTIRVIGKGNKERVVCYGDETAKAFAKQLRSTGRLVTGNERLIRYMIWQALKRHTVAARCSPHTLRHTWATQMVNNGAPLTTVSMLAGHVSTKTTEIYVHTAQSFLSKQYAQFKPIYT